MSPALSYGICILALLSQFLLAVSLRQLGAAKAEILAAVSRRRIRLVTAALLAGPVMAAAVVAGLNLFVFQGQHLMRAAHSLFSLGLWLALVMSFLMLALLYRMHRRPSIESLAGALLVVPLAAYLTPLVRFEMVYADTGLLLPLIVGGIMVTAAYLLTWQARSELH